MICCVFVIFVSGFYKSLVVWYLFNFPVFVDVSVFLLLLIFSKFVKSAVQPNIWFILEYLPHALTWEECVLWCSWMDCSACLLDSFGLWCYSDLLFVNFLSQLSIHWWKWGTEIPILTVFLYISHCSSVNICFNYFRSYNVEMHIYFQLWYLLNELTLELLFLSSVHFHYLSEHSGELYCFSSKCIKNVRMNRVLIPSPNLTCP